MALNLTDILKLPVAERILAVEAIWDSIRVENKEYPISDEELQMLEESWVEYKRSPQGAKTWEEVRAHLSQN